MAALASQLLTQTTSSLRSFLFGAEEKMDDAKAKQLLVRVQYPQDSVKSHDLDNVLQEMRKSEYLTDYDCCLGARISSSNSDLLTSKEDKSLAKVETGDQPRDVTLSVDEQYYCKTATKQQVSASPTSYIPTILIEIYLNASETSHQQDNIVEAVKGAVKDKLIPGKTMNICVMTFFLGSKHSESLRADPRKCEACPVCFECTNTTA